MSDFHKMIGAMGNHRVPHPRQQTYLHEYATKYPRLYTIWRGMIRRCYSRRSEGSVWNSKVWSHYGGRGISVCEEWRNNFNSFVDWSLANGYNDSLTIDRIDNDKNYDPSNCKWSTRTEQSWNTSRNVKINVCGIVYSMREACEKFNLKRDTIARRIRVGDVGLRIVRPCGSDISEAAIRGWNTRRKGRDGQNDIDM